MTAANAAAPSPGENFAPAGEEPPVRLPPVRPSSELLLEVAWEACNQVGGIYTVLRSKAQNMVQRWANRYALVGPYNSKSAPIEFEPTPGFGWHEDLAKRCAEAGLRADFGKWLVSGRPNLILLHHRELMPELGEIKYRLWEDHNLASPEGDALLDETLCFGEAVRRLLGLLDEMQGHRRPVIAHFHEWMAASGVPALRKDRWPGSIVFTTHATLLGRYLAMNTPDFYDHLPFFDAAKEAKHFNIETAHGIERAAAHGAHVFTTVSEITGDECTHLLGRTPDMILPNGLNIERFAAVHEFQNLHQQYKEKLHDFSIGHFFPSYGLDLSNTLYMFTAGRYEYRNKDMDVTIEALARLNHRLRQSDNPVTVVFFIITRAPTRSVSVGMLERRALLTEFRNVTELIQRQVGDRLVREVARGGVPDLNLLVDDYLRLRLKRGIQQWQRPEPPPIVTHDLHDDGRDDVLNALRRCNLLNHEHDRVKVVFHPDFVTSTSPLLPMEYEQFVRGTNLGVFPSYYEPWGYTPLECMALGVPAITSDLAGFGTYVQHMMPDAGRRGMAVVPRRGRSFDDAAEVLTDRLEQFCEMNQRERIDQRNAVEAASEHFDWSNLAQAYHEAHGIALDRI